MGCGPPLRLPLAQCFAGPGYQRRRRPPSTPARAGGDQGEIAIVGSSLGGFYARWLGERHGCRCGAAEPGHPPVDRPAAVHPGEQPLWHGGGTVTVERAPYAGTARPARGHAHASRTPSHLLAATGDEVLDYREMVAACRGAHIRILCGSDHGISEFADYVDDVLAFCGYGPGGVVPARTA
ncbi:YqiA/YcfP family alpha/beta fold hydrolase [Cupriavidus basilensis]